MNSEDTSELAEWHDFNQETIEALILDGSDAVKHIPLSITLLALTLTY
jgi:hypothetical protein